MQMILIGMPGCGKTTIGRMIAKRLCCAFWDLDEEIEREAGRKVSEIFAEEGEAGFRSRETSVLKSMLEETDAVIATGGGIVTREENRSLLENRNVVFIDRPLEQIFSDIAIQDRPLLADGAEKLRILFAERYPLYFALADIRIVNDQDAETAAERVCQAVKEKEENE